MSSNTLYVGPSQGHLIPECEKFLNEQGLHEELPYLLIVPNGARNLVFLKGTLELLKSIGNKVERIILALKASDRYERTLRKARETAFEIFPCVHIESFAVPVPDRPPGTEISLYIRCIDGRVASACAEVRNRLCLETGAFDVLSCPGGAANRPWIDQVLQRYYSKGLRIVRVVGSVHDDCKAGAQKEDLARLGQLIRDYYPAADVHCEYFDHYNGRWHSQPVVVLESAA